VSARLGCSLDCTTAVSVTYSDTAAAVYGLWCYIGPKCYTVAFLRLSMLCCKLNKKTAFLAFILSVFVKCGKFDKVGLKWISY